MPTEPSAVNEKKKRKKLNDPPEQCKRKGRTNRELNNIANFLQQPTAAEAEVPVSDDEEDNLVYYVDDVEQFSV